MSVIALQIGAFWQVWTWYTNRLWNAPGDSLGLLIFAVTFILLWMQSRTELNTHTHSAFPNGPIEPKTLARTRLLTPVIFFIGLYVILYSFVPPLIRAAIAISSLGTTLHLLYFGRLPQPAVWGLFLLALPVVPTMQFYFGYPARIVAATLTVPLLQLGGFAVSQEGTYLLWENRLIQFDAPCSGVKMLWAGLFVTFALASYYRLSGVKLVASMVLCLVAVLLGNVLRASSLFYIETDIFNAPSWWHSGIGLVVFSFIAGAIAYGVRWMQRCRIGDIGEHQAPEYAIVPYFGKFRLPIVFVVVCALAASMPLITSARPNARGLTLSPTWPKTFNDRPIRSLPLSNREKAFGGEFPGLIGRFTDGEREIVIRYVTQATRKLHPAADCFRGLGYAIEPAPVYIDSDESHWSCFRARRQDQTLRVYEQIIDADGQRWSDVSAWYWAAFWGRSVGPWWSYTVAEGIQTEQ